MTDFPENNEGGIGAAIREEDGKPFEFVEEGVGEGGAPAPIPGEGEGEPVLDEQVKWFNEVAGTQYKTQEEIQASGIQDRLKSNEELATNYGTQKQELETLRKAHDEIKGQINPREHFINDNEYIRQQMLRKHPELDPGVLTKVVMSDLDKMSAVDILKMDMKIQYPSLKTKDSAIVELLEEKFGSLQDVDLEDGSVESIKIQMAVQDAVTKFTALKGEIELPDTEAVETAKTEKLQSLTNEWKPFAESLPSKLDKVTLETKDSEGKIVPLLEYGIDDKFREVVKSKIDDIAQSQAKQGKEFTPEMQDALVGAWKKFYLISNLPKIIESHVGDVVSKMTMEQFQAIHNPSPKPKLGEAPEDGSPLDESMDAIEKDIMK